LIDYDFVMTGEGSLKINPKDKNYHKQGVYYVLVIADFGFFDLFLDNYYTFTL